MADPLQTRYPDPSTATRRRLSPVARRSEIVQAAVALFSENGFDGSTRDVASRAGITQPLLYRYFPNKESLVEAVYAEVYLDHWEPAWDALLVDRSRPVKQRFQVFYEAYTDKVFNPVWLRISGFAALRSARIHHWYTHVVEEMILKPLVRERRMELGGEDYFPVSKTELEVPWLMHGGLMDYGTRKHILEIVPPQDTSSAIAQSLEMYLLVSQSQFAQSNETKQDTGV